MNWLEYAIREFEESARRGAAKGSERASSGSIGSAPVGTFENFAGSPIASEVKPFENEKNASISTDKRDRRNPTSLLAVHLPSLERNSWSSAPQEEASYVSFGTDNSSGLEKSGGSVSSIALPKGASSHVEIFQTAPPSTAIRDVRDPTPLDSEEAQHHPVPIETIETPERQGVLSQSGGDDWTVHDWRSFFDERAAIAEHEGGMARAPAEAQAFDCCVVEWLNRNPIVSPPDHCSWCNGGERRDDVLLPFGVEATGHAWLHSGCWEPWRDWRQAEAVEALAGLGLKPNLPATPMTERSRV
jgi:hypothetical protein